MEQKIPQIVAEWIDETVLPDLADGHHTAEQIYDEIFGKCWYRIKQEVALYAPYASENDIQPLIDSWVAMDFHKEVIVNYVQKAFDSWEESK